MRRHPRRYQTLGHIPAAVQVQRQRDNPELAWLYLGIAKDKTP